MFKKYVMVSLLIGSSLSAMDQKAKKEIIANAGMHQAALPAKQATSSLASAAANYSIPAASAAAPAQPKKVFASVRRLMQEPERVSTSIFFGNFYAFNTLNRGVSNTAYYPRSQRYANRAVVESNVAEKVVQETMKLVEEKAPKSVLSAKEPISKV